MCYQYRLQITVCDTPLLPTGGDFTLSSDGYSVTFTCGEGYTMVGDQNIVCATDGSGWTLKFPSCCMYKSGLKFVFDKTSVCFTYLFLID